MPSSFSTELLKHIPVGCKAVGSLSQDTCTASNIGVADFNSSMQFTFPKYFTRSLFAIEEIKDLTTLYSNLYSESEVEVCSSFKKYSTLRVNGKQLGGYKTRSCNSSVVMVTWKSTLFRSSDAEFESTEQRPVRINYFAAHSIKVKDKFHSHVITAVSWFKKHPLQDVYGKPLTVWEHEIFEIGFCTFVPIQFIKCRTISLVDSVNF